MASSVYHKSFYSPSLKSEKRYCIYLPDSYFHRENLRYSVLYLLPGLMDYEVTWFEKGRVKEHMDSLIYDGKIGEYIIVSADKDDAALDINRKKEFSEYLAKDLKGHIDFEYRTIPMRKHCGIEGLSLGASWSVHMGINYPEIYSSIGALSGGYGDEIYSKIWETRLKLHNLGMRFRVGVGTWEPEFIPGNERFVNFMRDLGFYCELEKTEGPHDWPLWEKQIYNSLQFHYYSFNHQA